MTRRTILVLAALATTVLPAPVASAAETASAGVAGASSRLTFSIGPDGSVRTDAPARSVAERLRAPLVVPSAQGIRDLTAELAGAAPRTRERVERDAPGIVARARGLLVRAGFGSNGASSEEHAMAVEADGPSSHTYVFADPVGDLDGDGLADIVTGSATVPGGATALEARRGSDGRVLWTGPSAEDTYLIDAGDVDGDGSDDLLALRTRFLDSHVEDRCDDSGCVYANRVDFEQTTGVLDGATGAVAWTSAVERGHFELHVSDATDGAGTRTFDVVESWALPVTLAGPDADGDGGADLVMQHVRHDLRYHLEREDAVGLGLVTERREEWSVEGSTEAVVRRGRDGGVLWEGAVHDGLAVLEPTTDLAGDATPDLLWTISGAGDGSRSCRQVLGVTLECAEASDARSFGLELLDGATLDSVWTRAWDGVSDASVRPLADLDGDARGDLLVLGTRDGAEDGSERLTGLVSGRGGEVRWEQTGTAWMRPLATGDYDGDGASDLLTSWVEGWAELVVSRRDGRTGEELRRSTHPIGPGEGCSSTMAAVGPTDDVDGDGVGDVLVSVASASSDSCEGSWTTASGWWLESAASGAVVGDGSSDALELDSVVGDLVGDGTTEVVRDGFVLAPSGWFEPIWVEVRELAGDALWRTTLDPSSWLWFLGADVDGDGGGDVLLHREVPTDDGATTQRVDVRRGATGATLWTR